MGLFSKKKNQAVTTGEYFGTHPDIKGHKYVGLVATDNGITVREKKKDVVTFSWDKITGFEYDTDSSIAKGSRISATRVAALGVIGLVARKQQTSTDFQLASILHTTNGDIVLEAQFKRHNEGSLGANGTDVQISLLEKENHKFQVFVTDHISS